MVYELSLTSTLPLTGQPVPLLTLFPSDTRAVRRNMLRALDRLGMLAELELDASKLEQLALGQQVGARGWGEGSHFPSVNRPHLSGVGRVVSSCPGNAYSACFNIVQTLPAPRPSYASMHQERQLQTGLGLVWEIEKVIQVRSLSVHAIGAYHIPDQSQLAPNCDGRPVASLVHAWRYPLHAGQSVSSVESGEPHPHHQHTPTTIFSGGKPAIHFTWEQPGEAAGGWATF